MISLENFNILVSGILRSNKLSKKLSKKYGIDLYPIVKDLDMALSAAIDEIIPKDKSDYFYDIVYSGYLKEDNIEDLYHDIFEI